MPALNETTIWNGTEWVVPDPVIPDGVLRSLWDTDEIEPVLVTTVDETHPDDAWSGGGLGVHIIEVTFTEDTWRDLLVRSKPEDPEVISVWKQDPRAGATTGLEQPEYVGGYDVATNFWPFKFEANVTYYVGVYKETWEGAGGVVDIGPTQYGLENPSRLIAPRDLLFPISFAQGQISHAEGWYTHAETDGSHAEGSNTHAQGVGSHAEGIRTHAEGFFSHAEGNRSHSRWFSSHAASSGAFSAPGDAQYERVVLRGLTNARLWPNAWNSEPHTLPENYVAHYQGMIVSRNVAGTEVKSWRIEGTIMTAGTPTLLPGATITVVSETAGATGWDIAVLMNVGADINEQRALAITPSGLPTNARTVATLEFTEVG